MVLKHLTNTSSKLFKVILPLAVLLSGAVKGEEKFYKCYKELKNTGCSESDGELCQLEAIPNTKDKNGSNKTATGNGNNTAKKGNIYLSVTDNRSVSLVGKNGEALTDLKVITLSSTIYRGKFLQNLNLKEKENCRKDWPDFLTFLFNNSNYVIKCKSLKKNLQGMGHMKSVGYFSRFIQLSGDMPKGKVHCLAGLIVNNENVKNIFSKSNQRAKAVKASKVSKKKNIPKASKPGQLNSKGGKPTHSNRQKPGIHKAIGSKPKTESQQKTGGLKGDIVSSAKDQQTDVQQPASVKEPSQDLLKSQDNTVEGTASNLNQSNSRTSMTSVGNKEDSKAKEEEGQESVSQKSPGNKVSDGNSMQNEDEQLQEVQQNSEDNEFLNESIVDKTSTQQQNNSIGKDIEEEIYAKDNKLNQTGNGDDKDNQRDGNKEDYSRKIEEEEEDEQIKDEGEEEGEEEGAYDNNYNLEQEHNPSSDHKEYSQEQKEGDEEGNAYSMASQLELYDNEDINEQDQDLTSSHDPANDQQYSNQSLAQLDVNENTSQKSLQDSNDSQNNDDNEERRLIV